MCSVKINHDFINKGRHRVDDSGDNDDSDVMAIDDTDDDDSDDDDSDDDDSDDDDSDDNGGIYIFGSGGLFKELSIYIIYILYI